MREMSIPEKVLHCFLLEWVPRETWSGLHAVMSLEQQKKLKKTPTTNKHWDTKKSKFMTLLALYATKLHERHQKSIFQFSVSVWLSGFSPCMSAPPTEVCHSILSNKILPNPLEENSSLSKVNVHYPCLLHSVQDYTGGYESCLSCERWAIWVEGTDSLDLCACQLLCLVAAVCHPYHEHAVLLSDNHWWITDMIN